MIRFIRREKTHRESGFVLLSVLLVSLLFFLLIQMTLLESSEAHRVTQRFRSRVVAQQLAESAAELAAESMLFEDSREVTLETDEGFMAGRYDRTPDGKFEIEAWGESKGVPKGEARVKIWGRIQGMSIAIVRTEHQP